MPGPTQPPPYVKGSSLADGRLQVEALLGLGAYGVVYLARDVVRRPSTHARPALYAVKCLNKAGMDQRQRAFQRREILLHTMASSHPHVVTLHRVVDNPQDPCIYLVLDYCPDGDLFTMITEKQRYLLPAEPYVKDPLFRDGRPMPEARSYTQARHDMDAFIGSVFDQLLSAVEFCHGLGIYHRDLKPENILSAGHGRYLYLADFGLATGDRESSDFGCGSSFYMSPECQGGLTTRLARYNTAANDVWSLGVILINLICGRNPWKQAHPHDETFREYMRDPDFVQKILPLSDEVHAVLKRVFTLRAETRCSVSELRQRMRGITRLQASNLEVWQRTHPTPPTIRAYASPSSSSEARDAPLLVMPGTPARHATLSHITTHRVTLPPATTPLPPFAVQRTHAAVPAMTPPDLGLSRICLDDVAPMPLMPLKRPAPLPASPTPMAPALMTLGALPDWGAAYGAGMSLSGSAAGITPVSSPPVADCTTPTILPPLSPTSPQMPGGPYPPPAQQPVYRELAT